MPFLNPTKPPAVFILQRLYGSVSTTNKMNLMPLPSLMYRSLLLSLLLLPGIARSQSWAWFQTGGGTAGDACTVLSGADVGGWYAGGQFEGQAEWGNIALTAKGGKDVFYGQLDETGNWLWLKSLGGAFDDEVIAMEENPAGGFYLFGAFKVSLILGMDTLKSTLNSKALYLARFDPAGEPAWARKIEGSFLLEAGDLSVTLSGEPVIAGYFRGTLRTDTLERQSDAVSSAFAARFSSDGHAQWLKAFGSKGVTSGVSLDRAPGGDLYLGGIYTDTLDLDTVRLYANTFDQDIFIARMNGSGETLWAKRAGGVHDQELTDIASDESGAVYLAGFYAGVISLNDDLSISSVNGLPDHFLLKYQADGEPVWARSFGGQQSDQTEALAVNASGPAVAGFYQGPASWDGWTLPAAQGFAGYVASFDPDGQTRWAYALPGAGSVFPAALAFNGDNGLAMGGAFAAQVTTGGTTYPSAGGFDWMIGRLSNTLTPVAEPELTETAVLYPNPARDQVHIQSNAPIVELSVFDLNGRLRHRESGAAVITFSTTTLESGVYLVRLLSGSGVYSVLRLVLQE